MSRSDKNSAAAAESIIRKIGEPASDNGGAQLRTSVRKAHIQTTNTYIWGGHD